MLDRTEWRALTCCPRCRSALSPSLHCTNPGCAFALSGFAVCGGQPVLVDFDDSIFDPGAYRDGTGSVQKRDDARASLRQKIQRFIVGVNKVAPGNAGRVQAHLRAASTDPVLLVIGGGAIGLGTEALYEDPAIRVVGTDVYASENTQLISDAHRLPFLDASVDGVWIQAVLEHVLEPHRVVAEIFRVLKPGGIVYAETPFMQQVHEGAYDFTRFTASGHRWLFRAFAQIDAAPVSGAGSALSWSMQYFWRALGLGNKAAFVLAMPFFWLRFLDRPRSRLMADAASGLYFLGTKTGPAMRPRDLVAYYGTFGTMQKAIAIS